MYLPSTFRQELGRPSTTSSPGAVRSFATRIRPSSARRR